MPTRPLERLLFAQGGRCFFCNDRLSATEASVEHVVARANGGDNGDENCVACCKSLNRLLGRMSLKEKLRVMLNQQGAFRCPNGGGSSPSARPPTAAHNPPGSPEQQLAAIVADLQKRGSARPRTVRTLSTTISALFRKQLAEADIAGLLRRLESGGIITVNGTKVAYPGHPAGS